MDVIKADVVVTCSAAETVHDSADFVARLRARKPEDGGTTPVVLVTSAAEPPVWEIWRPDAVLQHPTDPWDLCRVISQLINAHGRDT